MRLYEEVGLISPPERLSNGYRVFTDCHIAQLRVARLALQIEILQNGLRRKIVSVVKTMAAGDPDGARKLTEEYLRLVRDEQRRAREAIELTRRLLSGRPETEAALLKRKEAAACLDITMDTLRNWEMNGLLTVRRKKNGYRVYAPEDMRRLKVIRSLRCANYSLEAIRRMLTALSADPGANLEIALNTPPPDVEILSACDQLIASLRAAENNARIIIELLREMKIHFY